jgi:S1-C subfamily serine protease/Flp pilus assembly protein TadD
VIALIIMVTPRNPASPEQVASAQGSSHSDKVADEVLEQFVRDFGKAARQGEAATPVKTGVIVDMATPGLQTAEHQYDAAPRVLEAEVAQTTIVTPPAQGQTALPPTALPTPALPTPAPAPKPPALSAEALYAMASPAVVRIIVRDYRQREIAQGSGFLVSADGKLFTNYHVIREAYSVSILLATEATLAADSVLAFDEANDIAILKVNGTGLPHVDLAPLGYLPAVGARVYALGNPQGLTNTISEGIVSALRRESECALIQTTAAISPGSSGGPLLDTSGRVVGMTTFVHADRERLAQNLNFAICSDSIHAVLNMAAAGKPRRLSEVTGAGAQVAAANELATALKALDERRFEISQAILPRLAAGKATDAGTWFARAWLQQSSPEYLGPLILNRFPSGFEQVEAAYKRAISLAPDVAEFHYWLGACYGRVGKFGEALVYSRNAIALKPDYDRAYSLLGDCLGKTGRYEEAIAAHLAAIRLKPESGFHHSSLAALYVTHNHYADAVREYKTAIRLHDADPLMRGLCWGCLGEVYLKMGNRSEAIRCYQTVARLKEKEPILAETTENLRRAIYGP